MDGIAAAGKLLQPGCPWRELQATWGAPNVKWCEETLCSWINEPANAWSNLAYLAVALWCAWQRHTTGSRVMGGFSWTLLLVGVCSFAYHATNNFGTQLLDFIGMYVLIFLLVASNLHRTGFIAREQRGLAHAALIVLGTLLVLVLRYFRVPYQFVVLAAILFIVGSELYLLRRGEWRQEAQDFSWALASLSVGAVFQVMDLKRIWCDPDNHWLQGHAAWHCCSALASLFIARHHAKLTDGDLAMPMLRA